MEDLGELGSVNLESIHSQDWVYGKNALSGLNLRVPVRMAHKLRQTLANNKELDSIEQR